MMLGLAGATGPIVTLAVSFVVLIFQYGRTNWRVVPFGFISSAFASGAMSLAYEAGVDDVAHVIVVGLMAANFVLIIGLLVPRGKS